MELEAGNGAVIKLFETGCEMSGTEDEDAECVRRFELERGALIVEVELPSVVVDVLAGVGDAARAVPFSPVSAGKGGGGPSKCNET